MRYAPAVNLRSKPTLILIPQAGAAAVLLSLECASYRADVLIIVYPGNWSLARRYSRRTWSM